MSYTMLILTVALAWLAVGVTLSVVMGRRGHDPFSWLLVGGLMGPLAFALAMDACRHGEKARPRLLSPAGSRGPGPVHVLAGVDGSSESRAAVEAAIDLLGRRVGRLTLVTVIPYGGGAENEREAQTVLEATAIALDCSPRLETLRGRPAPALLTRTLLGGYDVIVIGTKGVGASQAVFGSTARELARTSPVPVLMMGRGEAPTRRASVRSGREAAAPGFGFDDQQAPVSSRPFSPVAPRETALRAR